MTGTLAIIGEDGSQITKDVVSYGFVIDSDVTGEIEPSVTQTLKFDNKGQMSSITTQCGETENRRQAENKPNVTAEGVIVKDEIPQIRQLKNADQVTITSDIYSGPVIIDRVSITQESDLIYYQPNGGNKQLAFSYQLQFKEPE